MEITSKDYQSLLEKSRIGESLNAFLHGTGGYDVLNNFILVPLEEEAFIAFTKVDPGDSIQVIETQKMAQIIQTIRRTIETRIAEGQLARETLKTLPKESGE